MVVLGAPGTLAAVVGVVRDRYQFAQQVPDLFGEIVSGSGGFLRSGLARCDAAPCAGAQARCMPDFIRSTTSKTIMPATMAATKPAAFG